jgi:hypothetical protein
MDVKRGRCFYHVECLPPRRKAPRARRVYQARASCSPSGSCYNETRATRPQCNLFLDLDRVACVWASRLSYWIPHISLHAFCRQFLCLHKLQSPSMIMNPELMSFVAFLDPSPPVVWEIRSFSMMHLHQRYSCYCWCSRQIVGTRYNARNDQYIREDI